MHPSPFLKGGGLASSKNGKKGEEGVGYQEGVGLGRVDAMSSYQNFRNQENFQILRFLNRIHHYFQVRLIVFQIICLLQIIKVQGTHGTY